MMMTRCDENLQHGKGISAGRPKPCSSDHPFRSRLRVCFSGIINMLSVEGRPPVNKIHRHTLRVVDIM